MDILSKLEKLHDKVYVYRGAVKEHAELLEQIKALPNWDKWWVFGEITNVDGIVDPRWEEFPTQEEWDHHISMIEDLNSPTSSITALIEKYVYAATKHYIEEQGIELDNWVHQVPSVCVYKPEGGVTDEMAMHYHSDYQIEKAEARGAKFKITCTIYLNDDYDGGELAFKIRPNRTDPSVEEAFDYKPTPGDILVFPSEPPFYHGVKRLYNGDRYFIRNFWLEYFPGTPEWLAGEAKYGKETWEEMEKEREAVIVKGFTTIE